MDTIRRGSSGPLVAQWQQFLTDQGFDPRGVDGRFGSGTAAATREFQRAQGLGADGVVGPNTWAKAVEQGFRESGGAPTPPQRKLRKAVRNMTAEELEDFREAMRAMQALRDDRGFARIAGYHGAPDFHCEHGSLLFLPWHRAYVYWFEQYLQDHNANVTHPWWDWRSTSSKAEGLPAAYADSTTPDGDHNPLLNSHINVWIIDRAGNWQQVDRPSQRAPQDPSTLPFPFPPAGNFSPDPLDDLDELLSVGDFTDFSMQLEQLHGWIHVWVGGDMGQVPLAAFDPIFWAHHTMIDRIWYLWQLRHGVDNIPANLLDEPLQPFNMTTRDVLNIADLGYDYAGTQIVVGSGS